MSLNVQSRPPSPPRRPGVLSFVPGVLSVLLGLGSIATAALSFDERRVRGPELGASLLWSLPGLAVGGIGWAMHRRPGAEAPRRVAAVGGALSALPWGLFLINLAASPLLR